MKLLISILFSIQVIACSSEPDCVKDSEFNELVKKGEARYSELKKHLTCYDENGQRY